MACHFSKGVHPSLDCIASTACFPNCAARPLRAAIASPWGRRPKGSPAGATRNNPFRRKPAPAMIHARALLTGVHGLHSVYSPVPVDILGLVRIDFACSELYNEIIVLITNQWTFLASECLLCYSDKTRLASCSSRIRDFYFLAERLH